MIKIDQMLENIAQDHEKLLKWLKKMFKMFIFENCVKSTQNISKKGLNCGQFDLEIFSDFK